jgi:hypothetical protein
MQSVQYNQSHIQRHTHTHTLMQFWLCIAKLGLISSQDSAKSSITDDDARQFLEYEEPEEMEVALEDDMDADDLVWNISSFL